MCGSKFWLKILPTLQRIMANPFFLAQTQFYKVNLPRDVVKCILSDFLMKHERRMPTPTAMIMVDALADYRGNIYTIDQVMDYIPIGSRVVERFARHQFQLYFKRIFPRAVNMNVWIETDGEYYSELPEFGADQILWQAEVEVVVNPERGVHTTHFIFAHLLEPFSVWRQRRERLLALNPLNNDQ